MIGVGRARDGDDAALMVPAECDLGDGLRVLLADFGEDGIGEEAVAAFGEGRPSLLLYADLVEGFVLGVFLEEGVSFDLVDFYHKELHLMGVDTRKLDAIRSAKILEALKPGFESGELKPSPIQETYPLARAIEAYEQINAGANTGKLIIDPRLS